MRQRHWSRIHADMPLLAFLEKSQLSLHTVLQAGRSHRQMLMLNVQCYMFNIQSLLYPTPVLPSFAMFFDVLQCSSMFSHTLRPTHVVRPTSNSLSTFNAKRSTRHRHKGKKAKA
jgi:hypothetical protein